MQARALVHQGFMCEVWFLQKNLLKEHALND